MKGKHQQKEVPVLLANREGHVPYDFSVYPQSYMNKYFVTHPSGYIIFNDNIKDSDDRDLVNNIGDISFVVGFYNDYIPNKIPQQYKPFISFGSNTVGFTTSVLNTVYDTKDALNNKYGCAEADANALRYGMHSVCISASDKIVASALWNIGIPVAAIETSMPIAGKAIFEASHFFADYTNHNYIVKHALPFEIHTFSSTEAYEYHAFTPQYGEENILPDLLNKIGKLISDYTAVSQIIP